MKKIQKFILPGLLILFLISCDDGYDNQPATQSFSWDFSEDAEGFMGDFADYPIGEGTSYGLTFEHTMLPEPLDQTEGALMLSGTNMSDDLFMFAKKKITGLDFNASYNVTFRVEFASNVPDGQAGVGGSPGESVWIKMGVVPEEPVPSGDNMDYYRMNIDKGAQSQGGSDMVVLGDFSNDTNQDVYTLKTVENEAPFEVTTDAMGSVWLIVGTDSGFESTTTIYYNFISATFEKR